MAYGLISGQSMILPTLTNPAQPNQLLTGTQLINQDKELVNGTMPNRGTITQTLTQQGQKYTIPRGYHSGSGKITANFSNLIAENIKSGVNIGGVVGTANTFTPVTITVNINRVSWPIQNQIAQFTYIDENFEVHNIDNWISLSIGSHTLQYNSFLYSGFILVAESIDDIQNVLSTMPILVLRQSTRYTGRMYIINTTNPIINLTVGKNIN